MENKNALENQNVRLKNKKTSKKKNIEHHQSFTGSYKK